jgi:hypothetical protein
MTHTLDSTTKLDTTTDTMRAAVVTEFGARSRFPNSKCPHPASVRRW